MKIAIRKNTDQLNYEDFLGGKTMVVTITGVREGSKEQQYDLSIAEDTRYWRPPATVLKILQAAWGEESDDWIGKRAMLHGDPHVRFGKEEVGGIRVSHLSGIDKTLRVRLSTTRGRRAEHAVEPLPAGPAVITDDQADDFATRILEATTIDQLNTIAGDLKTWDLGGHRQRLGTAWTARKNEIAQPVQGAIDEGAGE